MTDRHLAPWLFAALAASAAIHIFLLAAPTVPAAGGVPTAATRPLALHIAIPGGEAQLEVDTEAPAETPAPPPAGPEPRLRAAPETPRPAEAPPRREGPDGRIPLPLEEPYLEPRELDRKASPIDLPPLILPEAVVRRHIRGKVELKVFIAASGRVDAAEILSSSHPGLIDPAALEVARATVFSPGYRSGRAVRSQKRIEVVFDPDDPGPEAAAGETRAISSTSGSEAQTQVGPSTAD